MIIIIFQKNKYFEKFISFAHLIKGIVSDKRCEY